MDKLTQEKFVEMVKLYHAEPEPQNFETRNSIFVGMLPWLSRWVASYLKTKGRFLDKSEMLSVSWDAFVFALKGYKNFDVPLPHHFSRYMRYFLSRAPKPLPEVYVDFQSNSEDDDERGNHEFVRLDEINPDSLVSHIGAIDNIKRFHSYLDNDYRVIFEDALSSLHNNRRARTHRQSESRVAYDRYCEAKKVMKMVVKFLLEE